MRQRRAKTFKAVAPVISSADQATKASPQPRVGTKYASAVGQKHRRKEGREVWGSRMLGCERSEARQTDCHGLVTLQGERTNTSPADT
mmetsp:Transcript_20018/g.48398  ORF Transcript_20018/g.48398 Transcript_20018/m.48398 type:complete len:88 (-) Transcript_20018:62-325(-)